MTARCGPVAGPAASTAGTPIDEPAATPTPATAAGSLLSAHRGGAGDVRSRENTAEALRAVTALDCEYVEIDVQRCRDGRHVVRHDRFVRIGRRRVPVASLTAAELADRVGGCLLLEDALTILRGRAKLHLDLKAVAGTVDAGSPDAEVALVRAVVEVVGAGDVVVTGLDDDAVAAVRAWARGRCPELLVGMALSRGVLGDLCAVLTGRLDAVLPGRRLRACDANLVVCARGRARRWGARWAQRRGLPLLVWTVDDPGELRAWLGGRRAWLVTTNHPRRAAALRRELAGTREETA